MSVTVNRRFIPAMVLTCLFFSLQLTASTPAKNNQKKSLFKLAPENVQKSLDVVDAVYLNISPNALSDIYNQKSEQLDLQIPTGSNTTIDLQLTRKNFLTDNFVVTKRTANGAEPFDYEPGLYYHGTVVGEPNSLVAISFFKDKIMAVLSYDGDDHNLGISTDAMLTGDDVYVLYPESNLLVGNHFECHTSDDNIEIPVEIDGTQSSLTVTENSVKMYMECDYLMYQDFGSNVTTTTDFVTNMFNVVSAVYEIDDICMELNEVFVWATQDPYPTSSSNAALDAFESQLNGNFNGDLAHLLSTSNNGNGGLAYVDVLCYSQLGIAYSNIDPTYSDLPNFSWTVEVVTHEIGHNLGSPHTHSCSWSGGAIDNCFCVEGSCSPGPEPAASGGTIMSYCHLTGSSTYGSCEIPGFPNPGINLNLGFGPQPSTLIYNKIESASCLTACGDDGGGGGGGTSPLDCTAAVELFSGVTHYGNTDNGAANVSSYTCANYDEPGNEVVHYFTAPVSGVAQIDYNENVAGYIDLFVLSACNPAACLLYLDGGVGVTGTMDVVAGETYYFVTDVYVGGNGGAYDLTISFPDGACQCDNPLALTCDNLESYNEGVLGPQTVCWTTWNGVEGGLSDGLVNSEQAFSGSQSVKLEGTVNGGPQDVVFLPGNYTSGHFQLSYKIYVPVGKAAYCNVLHQFLPASETYQWASEILFNTNGTGSLNAGVQGATTFSYTQGSWIDVVQDIDIDNDLTSLSIGGTPVYSWPFSHQAAEVTGGINALAAVNFYPIDNTYEYWIDDIELTEITVNPVMSVSPSNQNVSASSGVTTFNVNSNITWSVSDNANWLTMSPTGANGNGTIDAIYTENTVANDRVATVTITGGGLTQTVTVTQAAATVPISINLTTINETCYGAADGTIDLTVFGGTSPYTYNWSNGASTEDLNDLTGGTYSCTITDAIGTSYTTTEMTIDAAPQIITQIQTPGTLNCNQLNIVIDATASTSGAGIAASWTTATGNILSGANTLTPLVDAPGDYILTLTYNNDPNCIVTEAVTIVEVPALTSTVSSTPANGTASDGTAIVTVTGGTLPYQYSWSTTPSQTTQLVTGLMAGTYSVTVVDADGCLLISTVDVDALTNTAYLEGLNKFDLFPNPSAGLVNLEVEMETASSMKINIYDVLGTVVWTGAYTAQNISQQIDLTDLSSAVYFVEINVGEARTVQRLLIRR